MSAAARLFAAVELPAGVRAALAGWGERAVGGRAALRAVPPENLHVTLCFLGARAEAEAEAIGELVRSCADGPVALALGPALWLAPRRPHVLTVAIEDPDGRLGALQAAVAAALVAGAGFAPEPRPFRPHVTVARVRGGARVRPGEVTLEDPPVLAFPAAAVTLFRSHLGRDGARYAAVARAPLA